MTKSTDTHLIGWDIGGAHLKAARVDNGRVTGVTTSAGDYASAVVVSTQNIWTAELAAWTGVAIALAAWLVPMGTAVAWSVTLGWLISGIIWHVLGGRRWPPTDSRHGKEA